MKPKHELRSGSAADPSGPQPGKYHDLLPSVRRLLAASASRVTAASFLQLPNFLPAVWPLGAALLYLLLLVLAAWAASFLALLTVGGGSAWIASVPAVIFFVEFVLVPVIKYPAFLRKSVAAMRAFTATDRKTRDSFHHRATMWWWHDFIVLALLLVCFAAKLYILQLYGAFQPVALLSANYAVAVADLAAHLAGLTSKVPYFALARLVNFFHRRRRLREAAAKAEAEGRDELDPLPLRHFVFECEADVLNDEVDSHQLRRKDGGEVEILTAGTLDDADRAAFLHRQGHYLRQAALARLLARVQLELLDAPEMRPGGESDDGPPFEASTMIAPHLPTAPALAVTAASPDTNLTTK